MQCIQASHHCSPARAWEVFIRFFLHVAFCAQPSKCKSHCLHVLQSTTLCLEKSLLKVLQWRLLSSILRDRSSLTSQAISLGSSDWGKKITYWRPERYQNAIRNAQFMLLSSYLTELRTQAIVPSPPQAINRIEARIFSASLSPPLMASSKLPHILFRTFSGWQSFPTS